MSSGFSFKPYRCAPEELWSALQWLDLLLAEAIAKAQAIYGVEAANDMHRGLYINDEEVERLLARQPGHPLFQVNQPPSWLKEGSPLSWLQRSAKLDNFDVTLILIALAPEIDLRYERLYAYLQDDVTRKRPTVDLALNLLCASADEKLQQRHHFNSDAPLIREAFFHLIPDSNQVEPPLLNHFLKLDEQIVQFLLGQTGIDRRLEPFCQISHPSIALKALPLTIEVRNFLKELIEQVRTSQQSLKLYLQGVPGIGKRRVAEAIASALDLPILVADFPRACSLQLDVSPLLRVVFREAHLKQAVLYLPGIDQFFNDNKQKGIYQGLLEELAKTNNVTVLGGVQSWVPTTPYRSGVISVALEIPDFAQRRTCWETCLSAAEIVLAPQDLDALANRFRLTPEQITDAVVQASHLAHWSRVESSEHAERTVSTQRMLNHLFTAARNQAGHELQTLTHKIQPRYSWADIVLPADQNAQLRAICSQVKYRQIVYQTWGFERKLSLGKGVTALFSGPPGTGKTMAAEVIASDLQLDLYKIDLSQVVSKYIGETEKNLDRIFTAAETANAILFFDEADALFGKRSEVKDAHDRYANIEIGYLLQKIEASSGLSILATNLRQNLDEAFIRRLQFIVEFPFPDEKYRQQIWEVLFPPEAPLDPAIDFELLAREVRLAGGNLKNIALAAAFYAAEAQTTIQMQHLVQAAQREYQKVGRTWQVAEE